MDSLARLCVTGLIAVAAGLAEGPDLLDRTLTKIQANVAVFQEQLPDFVCREKITSRTEAEKDGRLERQTVIESAFSGVQRRSLIKGTAFQEHREIEKVDGEPWPRKDLPKGVFLLGGGYSSVLVTVFGAKARENYAFSIPEGDQGGTPGSIVIAFASRNRKQRIRGNEGTSSYQASGRAWFDPSSHEILRLEERIAPAPGSEGLLITVDYQAIPIGERVFRMPVRVSATGRRKVAGEAQRGVYTAEYSDYRKYGAASAIQYHGTANR